MISSLESLKCLCSAGDKTVVERSVDQVLTGIMYGVTQDQEDTVVTALQALLECLDWTAGNFARQQERNYIMSLVCNLTQSDREEVASLALECLSRIVTLYYPLMEEYMMVALVPISLQALQSRQERRVLQAVEFWSNICDSELALADDGLSQQLGDCSETLVEVLQRIMMEADTSQLDMEQWSQFTAAANCLSLLAQCLGARVTDRSLAFSSRMIQSSDWRNKHTAIISLSTILEMEDRQALTSIVSSFLSLADSLLESENPHIRTAASYLLLQISDRAEDTVRSDQSLSVMSGLVCLCLQSQQTRIAEQGCLILSNILRGLEDQENSPGLSECLGNISQHLLSLTDTDCLTARPGSSLRQLAFSALSDLVDQEGQWSDWLNTLPPRLLRRLDLLLSGEPSSPLNTDISFNSSILNSIILRLDRADVLAMARDILHVISKMFDHQPLHEDALLLLRALVDQLGCDMREYIPNIVNVVQHYTQTLHDSQVSVAAVGMIGDLYSKASELMPTASTDSLVQNLLAILSSDETERLGLRPESLATLTDIMLHSADSARYVIETVRVVLQSSVLLSSETVLPGLHLLSALLQLPLSQSLLHTWTGRILSSLLESLQSQAEPSDSLVRRSVGILGDLATHHPHTFSSLPHTDIGTIRRILNTGEISDSKQTRDLAQWAGRQLLNVYNNNVEIISGGGGEGEGEDGNHLAVKKAKVCSSSVFYNVRVTVTNKQFITQNIETENVTIKLSPPALPPVIECSDVQATVKLPRVRKKRNAIATLDFGEEKKYKEDF